jgi:hypothetical protein
MRRTKIDSGFPLWNQESKGRSGKGWRQLCSLLYRDCPISDNWIAGYQKSGGGPLKHFHKYCDLVRAGYVQSFFDGTPAKSAAPSLTPFVKML